MAARSIFVTWPMEAEVCAILERVGTVHPSPTEHELHTFLLHPPDAPLPAAPLTHPVQLYPYFMAYADGASA